MAQSDGGKMRDQSARQTAFVKGARDVRIPVVQPLSSLDENRATNPHRAPDWENDGGKRTAAHVFLVVTRFVHVLVFCFLFSLPMADANDMVQVNTSGVFDYGMAIGLDKSNETILILGGSNNGQRLLTFKDSVVEQQSDLNINGWIFGYGQYYTQLNDTLWMIDVQGKSFITFNTKTRESDEPNISIFASNLNLAPMGCLASTQSANGDEYLFVVGGRRGDIGWLDSC